MTWTLLMTGPQREAISERAFKRAAIPYRLYRCRKRLVRRGRLIDTTPPAFGRYAFVDLEGRQWDYIHELPQISGFVCFEGKPVSIHSSLIDTLDAQLTSDGYFPTPDPPPKFRFNDWVRVTADNAAYGCEAMYQCLLPFDPASDKRACLILLPWLGQMIPTQVDERDLELLEPRKGKKRRRSRRGQDRRRRQHPELREALLLA